MLIPTVKTALFYLQNKRVTKLLNLQKNCHFTLIEKATFCTHCEGKIVSSHVLHMCIKFWQRRDNNKKVLPNSTLI